MSMTWFATLATGLLALVGLMLTVFGTGTSLVPLKATGGNSPERSEP